MLINYPHKLQGGELGYWDASRSIDPETGRSPKFDLGLAPLPRFAQSGRDVTYSSYFAEAVVSQDRPKEAWDFLRYLSSIDFAQYQESPAYTFASRTNLPTAVRSNDFLSEQQNITFERFSNRINFDTGEPLLEVAIRETLKAETYQKRNYQEFENQIDNMILAVNLFKNPFEVSNRIGVSSLRPRDAIDKAIRDITEIINQ
jgi:ABC-type glycerol-3-phosphate transport system substrate-binding protein